MDERYEDAYKRALAPINTVAAMARSLAQDQSALTAMRVSKGLAPITYLNTLAPTTTVIFKARYGEEENEAADKIYLLDVKAMLNNDARLTPTQTAHYQLWQNSQTYHNVFMLPNAARLYLRYTTLDYVTDILHGDLTGDGEADDIEVISALNAYAYENPIIPIGSTGTLNFANGDLTIPAYSDFELYLSEVSAAWLTDSLKSGYIRTMAAEQDAINAFAEDGVSVPDGAVLQVLIDGGEAEGCKLYWIGPDPEEEIEDPDKTLVLLVVNEETDEVEAFRTTAAKLAANEDPIPVSLFMYRDSQSDRQEDEKYNTFWFDTPENQKAIVKVVTDVLGDRQLEMPRPMHVVLRASKLEGTTLPVYALSDHIFVMNDGHTGSVSLFDGFYQATFDGETFESGFTKVEGIGSGDPTVTVKQDQPVWPEKTGEKTAEDLNGTKYTSDDNGEWTAEPVLSENEPADAA